MQLLGSQFRPEFLNRIDEIIIFRGLGREQLREITGAALDWLADRGFQPEFGARPLRRTIQRELDNELAELLLSGQFNPGDTAIADIVDGKLHITTAAG